VEEQLAPLFTEFVDDDAADHKQTHWVSYYTVLYLTGLLNQQNVQYTGTMIVHRSAGRWLRLQPARLRSGSAQAARQGDAWRSRGPWAELVERVRWARGDPTPSPAQRAMLRSGGAAATGVVFRGICDSWSASSSEGSVVVRFRGESERVTIRAADLPPGGPPRLRPGECITFELAAPGTGGAASPSPSSRARGVRVRRAFEGAHVPSAEKWGLTNPARGVGKTGRPVRDPVLPAWASAKALWDHLVSAAASSNGGGASSGGGGGGGGGGVTALGDGAAALVNVGDAGPPDDEAFRCGLQAAFHGAGGSWRGGEGQGGDGGVRTAAVSAAAREAADDAVARVLLGWLGAYDEGAVKEGPGVADFTLAMTASAKAGRPQNALGTFHAMV